jgi:hypothetical protein
MKDTTTVEGRAKRKKELAAPYREQLRSEEGPAGVKYAAMRVHELDGLEPEDMSAISRRLGQHHAKVFGYQLGYDTDYVRGMDDGEPPVGARW